VASSADGTERVVATTHGYLYTTAPP